VWECDPLAGLLHGQIVPPPKVHPAMGAFMYEAVAVDPVAQRVYLTEDRIDGGLLHAEGICFGSGRVYVATTADDRVHAYDTAAEAIEVLYDRHAVDD
jgi:sugar lactone lactonase YvrE